MHRVTWLLMLASVSGCIVDDWRYRPLDASALDADAPPPPNDVPALDVDASATSDADATSALDADVATPSDADVPPLSDVPPLDAPTSDASATPDAPSPDNASPPDVPPSPPGVVVRGAIAPSGAHSSSAARVRGSLSFVGRHCNTTHTVCITGGLSP